MNKAWDWLMKHLPTIWGFLIVGLITTGAVMLTAVFIKIFLQVVG